MFIYFLKLFRKNKMIVKIFLSLLILNLSWTIQRFASAGDITLAIDPENNDADCPECRMRLPSRYGKRNSLMLSELPVNELIDKYGDEIVKFFWRSKHFSGRGPKHLQSLTPISNTLDFLRQVFDRNKIKKLNVN